MLGSSISQVKSQLVRTVAHALPSNLLVIRGLQGTRESRKRVALTFDDGPDEMTPRYLRTLDQLHVRATFFLLGMHAEKRPELVRSIVAAGHEVASHGYSHRAFPSLDGNAL